MSREKQIEEMAKAMCGNGMSNGNCAYDDEPCNLECVYGCCAEKLYAKGYRKQSEWISIDERLPDCEYGLETEALLFRLKTGTVEAGYFGTRGIFRDKYFRHYRHAGEGWDAKDVTHWMPIPEPPKGE